MPAGTVVASGSLVAPGGQQGIPGPNAVSTDAGNQATFGSDSKIYVPDPTPTIWSARLRSFNAAGNSTFEVDQISCGATIANASAKLIDRWAVYKAGTLVVSAGQNSAVAGDVVVPTTNFRITSKFYRITVTTAQTSLGVNDALMLYQYVEGPSWRELSTDVHSIGVLVRSSVSALKFGVSVQDSPATKSLTKLCTIASANTWTLIPLPNLPVWPSGNFALAPGAIGYQFNICLAAGTTMTSPANDTWQNGNFIGATTQSNFAATASATFDVAFVQHEPGSLCTTLMDKPFNQNYEEALRYYQKTYNYGDAIGSTNAQGAQTLIQVASTTLLSGQKFIKPLAKVPGMYFYHHTSGVLNNFQHTNGTNYTISSLTGLGTSGFLAANTSAMPAPAAGAGGYVQYVLDTGW